MIFEKLVNNVWTFVDSLEYCYCFTNSQICNIKPEDYNYDGINDFLIEYHWKWNKNDNETIKLDYTFDKIQKTFFRIGFFSGKPIPLKGYKNLYYDEWSSRYVEWSYLFTFRNNERINLGIAQTQVKLSKKTNKEGMYYPMPLNISIKKFSRKGEITVENINKSEMKLFSFENYWIKNASYFHDRNSEKIVSQKNKKPICFQIID